MSAGTGKENLKRFKQCWLEPLYLQLHNANTTTAIIIPYDNSYKALKLVPVFSGRLHLYFLFFLLHV